MPGASDEGQFCVSTWFDPSTAMFSGFFLLSRQAGQYTPFAVREFLQARTGVGRRACMMGPYAA
jgi:hypothetical protein